jgi:hypothetical protein
MFNNTRVIYCVHLFSFIKYGDVFEHGHAMELCLGYTLVWLIKIDAMLS